MPDQRLSPVGTRRVVTVDLGGTKIAVAEVDASGRLGRRVSAPTPAQAGPAAVLDLLAALVGELGARPDALGIGTAGVVDVTRGRIVSSTDAIAGWAGTEVSDGLSQRLGIQQIHVQNDVDAHAAGEAWRGAGAGASSVLLVAIGTGIGAGIVLDGRPLRGAHHLGGEMGHQPVPGAEELRCACGRPGHLEAIAAGPAIARRYWALSSLSGTGEGAGMPRPESPDSRLTSAVDPHDARVVFALAEAGDELAGRVINEAAVALGRGLAGIVTVLDPERVIIGGGLPAAGPRWWDPMEAAFRAEVVDTLAGIPIVPAALGQDAALIGAAAAAWALLDTETRLPEASKENIDA